MSSAFASTAAQSAVGVWGGSKNLKTNKVVREGCPPAPQTRSKRKEACYAGARPPPRSFFNADSNKTRLASSSSSSSYPARGGVAWRGCAWGHGGRLAGRGRGSFSSSVVVVMRAHENYLNGLEWEASSSPPVEDAPVDISSSAKKKKRTKKASAPRAPAPVRGGEPFLTAALPGVPKMEETSDLVSRLNGAGFTAEESIEPNGEACLVPVPGSIHRPIIYQTRPLPSVLILHTGGTLGMSTKAFEEPEELQGAAVFKSGTGGDYTKTLQPGKLLLNLVTVVPELRTFANLEVKVLMNKDSCQIGPKEWIRIAKELHSQRDNFNAFIIVHGTDTLSYTASAVSLMLAGFRKPIIFTAWVVLTKNNKKKNSKLTTREGLERIPYVIRAHIFHGLPV